MAPANIVITGMGIISPIGIGRDAFRDALDAGRSGVRPITLFDVSNMPIRIGAEVGEFDPKKYVKPRKSLKVMSRDIQFAYAAADMAFEDAGLEKGAVEPDRLGVVFGSDMIYCDLPELSAAFLQCIKDEKFDSALWGTRAFGEMFPLWMLKYLPNMAACHIGIAQDARGPNNSITLGEVSSLLALAEGVRVIERGQADVMLVGGGGARIHPMPMVSRSDELYSHRFDDPQAASRPFDAQRDGMVNGEGAAAFVIERRESAQRRGANILASVAGYSSGFEPRSNGALFSGAAIKASIDHALRAAGWKPADVGHVNAHGAGTRLHDAVEAQAIHGVLGDVPVTAPTSFFGNLGAGAGAVEMAASLIALETGEIPVTLNYETPDPDCPVNVVHASPLKAKHRTALLLNHTTMGQAVAVALSAEG